MLEEIRDHLKGTTSVKRVEVVLFDRRSLEVFEKTFAGMKD
jgi:O-acetyl-ADP-ribose deacetylase (regulator of RNase III)